MFLNLKPYTKACTIEKLGYQLVPKENVNISTSVDGVEWTNICNLNICDNNFYDNEIPTDFCLGYSMLDTISSLVYDKHNKTYVMYCRCNIGINKRYVKYTTSIDLINWSSFKLITIDIYKCNDNDNIYQPHFFYYDRTGTIICHIDYLSGNKLISCFLHSYNYKNFFHICTLNEYDCVNIDNIYENINYKIDIPNVITNKKNCFEILFYIILLIKDAVYTMEYLYDRFTYVTNLNNTIGTFTTNKFKIYDNIIKINYVCLNDGYILYQLLDKNKCLISEYTFENCKVLKNSSLEEELVWNNNSIIDNIEIYVQIKLYNAQIYSIYGSIKKHQQTYNILKYYIYQSMNKYDNEVTIENKLVGWNQIKLDKSVLRITDNVIYNNNNVTLKIVHTDNTVKEYELYNYLTNNICLRKKGKHLLKILNITYLPVHIEMCQLI